MPGEQESGDLHLLKEFEGGALIAVVDGLGHGHEARVAAERATTILSAHTDESIVALIRRCHQALRMTRGAVLGLASFSTGGALAWIGVGNIDGAILSPRSDGRVERKNLFSLGGLLGSHLPTLNPLRAQARRDDLLVLATDGIDAGFLEDVAVEKPAQAIADDILARYALRSDDALVLVARFLGRAR